MYDEWRIGFIRRPIDHVVKPEGIQADAVTWLRAHKRLADPQPLSCSIAAVSVGVVDEPPERPSLTWPMVVPSPPETDWPLISS